MRVKLCLFALIINSCSIYNVGSQYLGIYRSNLFNDEIAMHDAILKIWENNLEHRYSDLDLNKNLDYKLRLNFKPQIRYYVEGKERISYRLKSKKTNIIYFFKLSERKNIFGNYSILLESIMDLNLDLHNKFKHQLKGRNIKEYEIYFKQEIVNKIKQNLENEKNNNN